MKNAQAAISDEEYHPSETKVATRKGSSKNAPYTKLIRNLQATNKERTASPTDTAPQNLTHKNAPIGHRDIQETKIRGS